jgi:hypothetical protein
MATVTKNRQEFSGSDNKKGGGVHTTHEDLGQDRPTTTMQDPYKTGRRHRSASPPPPPVGTKRTARIKKTDVASSNAKAGRFAKTPTTMQPPLLTTMLPPCNQQQRPARRQPQPSTWNVDNIRPTPNVPTVPFGASGTSMEAVPKAADRFRAKAAVIPPRQEYRQGDETRPQGGERFGYREQKQVRTTPLTEGSTMRTWSRLWSSFPRLGD